MAENVGEKLRRGAVIRIQKDAKGLWQITQLPQVEAALVKALGNDFEKLLPEIARSVAPSTLHAAGWDEYRETFMDSLLNTPAFTIRGGTREIMRGVIARGLGLR